MNINWTQIVIPLISGGLAGAVLTLWFNTRKQRLDVTLTVIKDYFAFYDDLGMVKGIFAAKDPCGALDDPNNLNRLRRIGDWFHYVASLLQEKVVDPKLLDRVAIIDELDRFREALAAAKSRCPKHLDHAWHWWPHIQTFKKPS